MSVLDRFRLDGKRALITGGSRGLGRAIAQALAEAGADLVLIGRDPGALQVAQRELAAIGREVDVIAEDVGTPEGARRMCERALDDGKAIDVLVNNVGGRRVEAPIEELTLDEWRHVLDLNLNSVFVCCQLLGTPMARRRAGSIINIASIAGIVVIRGLKGRSYETSKAGLIALTRSLAADWGPANVRVNAIAPGGFLTDVNRQRVAERPELQQTFGGMVPMARWGEAHEIGPLALYLASDAGSYMTGATLVIDGGYSLW
jgi:NAD(P)-dependent dehydrogenase (short-subunit alcohol dehydrogenase family)